MLKFIFKDKKRETTLHIISPIHTKFYSAFIGIKDNVSAALWGKDASEKIIYDIRDLLISYDFGVSTTKKIVELLHKEVKEGKIQEKKGIFLQLKIILKKILYVSRKINNTCYKTHMGKYKLKVILLAGANGVGKTTTASKIAHLYQSQGKSVAVVAGDRFRAAAIEQLDTLGLRYNIEVLSKFGSQDLTDITYESIEFAKRNNRDILIIDTAGRMHTREKLMVELKKTRDIINKEKHVCQKTLLVLDANLGQNSFVQTEKFIKGAGIDGLILTKLDGSAGGGIIFAIADKLQLNIDFIGFGENIKDIKRFNAEEYINTLLAINKGGNL